MDVATAYKSYISYEATYSMQLRFFYVKLQRKMGSIKCTQTG